MNSKKLCCICVLFSLLAGCASESSIDEKKKKAQVTQSNINKNTPQQLTDKDLFGNETTLAVSEEDIQAALDGDEFRVPLNSPVILVQLLIVILLQFLQHSHLLSIMLQL